MIRTVSLVPRFAGRLPRGFCRGSLSIRGLAAGASRSGFSVRLCGRGRTARRLAAGQNDAYDLLLGRGSIRSLDEGDFLLAIRIREQCLDPRICSRASGAEASCPSAGRVDFDSDSVPVCGSAVKSSPAGQIF